MSAQHTQGQGAALLPIGQTNEANNEQGNLGRSGIYSGHNGNDDHRPTGRRDDSDRLAEVVEEVNAEVEQGALGAGNSGVVDADCGNRSDGTAGSAGVVDGNDSLGQSLLKGQAGLRDRQTAPALDSATRQAGTVQTAKSLPIENKEVTNDCTDWKADCPILENWRYKDGQPPLPRNFSAVPHLRTVYNRVMPDGGTVTTETLTGWQLQWSTTCPACQKRFRPVAGFIPLRTIQRMQELEQDERRTITENIIRARFESGSISSGHPDCLD